METAGLGVDASSFRAFARRAIAGREQGKFAFTKSLSAALDLIAEYGAQLGFTRKEISNVDILSLYKLRGRSAPGAKVELRRMIRLGAEAHRITQAISLPGVILEPGDVACFEQLQAEPNYITEIRVTSPVAVADLDGTGTLSGCIAVVPSADPGYDWLFSQGIAGLITKYGGANSHMAIRAAEFGLPAAIGVGDLLYDQIAAAVTIELDCGARTVRTV